MGWCPLCPGQVMPPLPDAQFTCPSCPHGLVCGPCAPGEPIPPNATAYVALGAPASCPACPNNSPTKAQVEVDHEFDKKQLPVDVDNAKKKAQQNGRNVTLHVNHHHKNGRPGSWTREVNITYTSDDTTTTTTTSGFNTSTSSSTTSDVTTSTTTTTDYSNAPAMDYDYMVIDYVSTTSTTTDGGHHHHRKRVELLPESGRERHYSHNKSGPPQSTTTPMPDNIRQKKIRVPGVPPGEPQPNNGVPVTVTDASPYINRETQLIGKRETYNMSGRTETTSDDPGVEVTTDLGLTPYQTSIVAAEVAKNPSIVQWCPLCAGQAPPPLLPFQYPCPVCPTGQVCGSCAPGPQADDPKVTMFLNIGSCPSCPAYDTKSDWQFKHAHSVAAQATHVTDAEKTAAKKHAKVTVHTHHHRHPYGPSETTETTTGRSTTDGFIPTESSTDSFDTTSAALVPPPPAVVLVATPPGSEPVVRILPGVLPPGAKKGNGGAIVLPPGELPTDVGGTPPANAVPVTLPNGKIVYELVQSPPSPGGNGKSPKHHGGNQPSTEEPYIMGRSPPFNFNPTDGGYLSPPYFGGSSTETGFVSPPGSNHQQNKKGQKSPPFIGPNGFQSPPFNYEPEPGYQSPPFYEPTENGFQSPPFNVHPTDGGVYPYNFQSPPYATGEKHESPKRYHVLPGPPGSPPIRVPVPTPSPGVLPPGAVKEPTIHYHYTPGPPGKPPVRVPLVPKPPSAGPPKTVPNTPFFSTTTTTTESSSEAAPWHPAPPASGYWCSICMDVAPPPLPNGVNVTCPPCPSGQVCPACPVGSVTATTARRSLLGLPSWLGGKAPQSGDVVNYVVGVGSTLPRSAGGATAYLSATPCVPCSGGRRA